MQAQGSRICLRCGEELPERKPGPGRPRKWCAACGKVKAMEGCAKRRRLRPPCSVDGCERFVKALGLCGRHYEKQRADAKLLCSIKDCQKPEHARGWCVAHYAAWYKYGDPLIDKTRIRGICSVKGCGKPREAKGLCRNHWQKWHRKQPSQRARQAERDRGRPNRSGRTHLKRVRQFGSEYEDFDKAEIYERDGYKCQICGRKTRGIWPDPLSPTLDHIIPLSRGGSHTRANCQCACAACNLSKGDGAANDQLRLDVAA